MDTIKIFGQSLEKLEGTLGVLEGPTLEEIESIRTNLDGRTQTEIETRQIIATLECRLMEALNTIDSMKTKIEAFEKQVNVGMSESTRNVFMTREAKIEAPKPPMCNIDAMKTKIETLKKQVNVGMTESARNVFVTKEAKIEAPEPPMYKRVHDA